MKSLSIWLLLLFLSLPLVGLEKGAPGWLRIAPDLDDDWLQYHDFDLFEIIELFSVKAEIRVELDPYLTWGPARRVQPDPRGGTLRVHHFLSITAAQFTIVIFPEHARFISNTHDPAIYAQDGAVGYVRQVVQPNGRSKIWHWFEQ